MQRYITFRSVSPLQACKVSPLLRTSLTPLLSPKASPCRIAPIPSNLPAKPSPRSLTAQWDHPELLRRHLASMSEPKTSPKNPAVCRARLALISNSVKKLRNLKEAISPRTSEAINDRFAEKSYKRKFLAWNSFAVNSLPIEILQHIFRYVVLSAPNTTYITSARLLLTSACSHWRTVAISDVRLWNTVYFDDRPPWGRSLLWLDRAGSALLDIRIDEPKQRPLKRATAFVGPQLPTPSITPAQIEELLRVVLTKLSQLRLVILVLDRWDTALLCLRTFSQAGTPASLERFELHRGQITATASRPAQWIPEPHNTQDITDPIVFCNGVTPNLKTLCLGGINIDWTRFSASTLTILDLRRLVQFACPDGPTFRRILSDAPLLRRLSLSTAGPQLYPSEKFQPVSLPALREFLLGDCSLDYAMCCLSQFDAPNLVSLTLLNLLHADFAPMLAWITGRFPKVEILAMYTVQMVFTDETKRTLVRWLDSMPGITLLKVSQMPDIFYEAFMEDPRQYDATPPLPDGNTKDDPASHLIAPKLRSFHVTNVPKEMIIHFVQRRQQTGLPLTNLYIPISWAAQGLSQKGMREIHDTGLKVRIMQNAQCTDEEEELATRP